MPKTIIRSPFCATVRMSSLRSHMVWPMRTEGDWDEAGLLDGLDPAGRTARLALLRRLEETGFPLAEIQRAAELGDLALMLADQSVGGTARWTGQEILDQSGI